MTGLYEVQAFLKRMNPSWNFGKIAFVSFLLLKILNANRESFGGNYKLINKINGVDVYFDDSTKSFGLIYDKTVKVFNDINEVKQFLLKK